MNRNRKIIYTIESTERQKGTGSFEEERISSARFEREEEERRLAVWESARQAEEDHQVLEGSVKLEGRREENIVFEVFRKAFGKRKTAGDRKQSTLIHYVDFGWGTVSGHRETREGKAPGGEERGYNESAFWVNGKG